MSPAIAASTLELRHRAESPRRASPCFATPAAGPRDCLIAPGGTAACARASAAAAQSRRSSSYFRVVANFVFIYTEYDITSIAIAPSAVMTQARSADITVRPVRRADRFFASLRVLGGWPITTGTRSARPNASRRLRASWRNSGARPVPRAGLPGRGLAQQAVGVPPRIVEHVAAHPFEVRNARRQKRSAPTTPRASKTAHADLLITLSGTARQCAVFTEREPAGGSPRR
jgi:hypothetical protein